MEKDKDNSRRLAFWSIDNQMLISVLNAINDPNQEIVSHHEIPEGARVEQIWQQFERACWCVALSHETFPEVPEACLIPEKDSMRSMFTIRRII